MKTMKTASELWKMGLEDLKTTNALQANDRLFNGKGYCCLGRLDVACFGAVFHKVPDDYEETFTDELGEALTLHRKRVKQLGLHKTLSKADRDYLGRTHCDREDAMIYWNDVDKLTFKQIAKKIKELGWDKD